MDFVIKNRCRRKKTKVHFFLQKTKIWPHGALTMVLGPASMRPDFWFSWKKMYFCFFSMVTVRDYCLTQTQTTNIFFQIHPNLVLFWLQITFILHIIHMKNFIGQFFLSKTYFWGKNLIFGVKNWFLGLKLIFLEKKCCWWFFLHKFYHFYT